MFGLPRMPPFDKPPIVQLMNLSVRRVLSFISLFAIALVTALVTALVAGPPAASA